MRVIVRYSRLGSLDHPAVQIEPCDFRHENVNVIVRAKNRANRCSDFSRGKTGGRYLVEKRLKGVVIFAVDDGNLSRRFRQRLRRIQACEAGTDNHDPRFYLAVHRRTYIRFGAMAEVSGKFFESGNPGMGALGPAFRGRLDFCCAAGHAGVHPSVRASTGRRWDRVAHPDRAANSGHAHHPARRSVFRLAWEPNPGLPGNGSMTWLSVNWKPLWDSTGWCGSHRFVIAAVFALLFRLLTKGGTNVLVALVLVLLALASSMIHFLARPLVLSWLSTLIWVLDPRRLGAGL